MTAFDLPDEFANEIDEHIQTGAVRLPFAAPFFKWINGDPNKANLKNAQYFGGWSIGRDRLDEILGQLPGRNAPLGLVEADLPKQQGTFPGFVTRFLAVAIFGRRYRWLTKENKSHVQWLAWLADYNREEKKFIPWGPIVFSSKGLSTLRMDKAINQWATETAGKRMEVAKNTKHWFFYVPLGTFLTEPEWETVGETAQSDITPCQTILPDEINQEYLSRHFVGADIAALMIDHKRQAEKWLTTWNKSRDGNGGVKPQDFQPPEPEAPPEDPADYPF